MHPGFVDEDGDSLLHGAKDPEMIRVLVEAGADLYAVNDRTGWTPLMTAAVTNAVAGGMTMIELGADMAARDHSQCTAVQLATTPSMVLALIKKGALKHLDPEEIKALAESDGPRTGGAELVRKNRKIMAEIKREIAQEFRNRKEGVIRGLKKTKSKEEAIEI